MGEQRIGYVPEDVQETPITSAEMMATRLGFSVVSGEFAPGERKFSLKTEGTNRPRELILHVNDGIDAETGASYQAISLNALWPDEEDERVVSDLTSHISSIDIARIGELGFSRSALEQGGYQFLKDIIEQAPEFLYQDERPQDPDTEIQNLAGVVAEFQKKFPELSRSDVSKKDNMLIFGEPNEDGLVHFVRIYTSGSGFNVQLGEAPIKVNKDKSSTVDLKSKNKKTTNVPTIAHADLSYRQRWDYGDTQDAVEVAEVVNDGLVVDQATLDQVVSISTDREDPEFLTFRDLLRDQLRLETITNNELLGAIGKLDLPYSAPIQVRRILQVSDEELKAVALRRLSDHQQQTAVEQGSVEGQRIVQREKVRVEAQLALIQMGRFTLK